MIPFLIVLRYSGKDKQESKSLYSNMTRARGESRRDKMPVVWGVEREREEITNEVKTEVSLET